MQPPTINAVLKSAPFAPHLSRAHLLRLRREVLLRHIPAGAPLCHKTHRAVCSANDQGQPEHHLPHQPQLHEAAGIQQVGLDNVGVLLRGTKREDVERGQVLVKPGSIKPHTTFTGSVYVLSKEEGGRHTPFFANYRPQFYFRTTDVTGAVSLPEGVEMVMPGDNVEIKVELIAPIAMEEGLRFAIREGGRTVGAGVVAKIIA